MSAASDRFRAEVGELAGRRREEIIAELAECEPAGIPDPDETPEFMAQVIIEHEVHRAVDGRTYPHEEVMRVALAPTTRWEAYRGDPGELDEAERQRLKDAGEILQEVLGLTPEAVSDAAGIIACLVLRREQWEPDLPPRDHLVLECRCTALQCGHGRDDSD